MIISKKGPVLELHTPKKWEQHNLDNILRNIWKAPKKWIHKMRMEKKITINHSPPDWNSPLKAGDIIQIHLFVDEQYGVIPHYHPLEILYEDNHLLVVNKPANMDTHPNEPGQTNTLANAVASYFQQNGEQIKVRHVHRLDRDTTGAVLFAKNDLSGAILDRMLEERRIKRTYWALADGVLKVKKGTINKAIGKDRHHPTRRRVSPGGQPAVTHYKVLKSFPKAEITLVECTLDTGRTHQIRVHLSDMGFPLCGDKLYGGSSRFARQALHARYLDLPHPLSGEPIHCTAPFLDEPPIFEKWVPEGK
ncbi:RluA family pseudouridine synthase [Falsibacillus albus]|uniref:Pseudouridine synthase n=1 Tax=Falsibacillus albus TaxID=2478915 RepID=A0A3L7K537_9BACI|nr:RluA family pseudouridine synthase [Falsibacillus albus]RLQ97389.1 RluA family pseudouridine synthase [Falsibacillus albus]